MSVFFGLNSERELQPGQSAGPHQAGVPATVEQQVTHLFEQAREDVYRYLLMLGVPPPQAQETTQDVFLRLYVASKKADNIENKRAWVFRVAHNLGVRLRVRERAMRGFDNGLEARLADSANTPEEAAIARQCTARIRAALATLSPQQRRCLYLRAQGFRYQEIADILGISDSSVGEFLRRAIDRIRKARNE